MTNAVQNIWKHSETHPERIALREGSASWTYADLRATIEHASVELRRRGVGHGDKVLMVVPTSAEFVFVYYAILAVGATAVTVNTLSTAPELQYFLEDAECVLAVGVEDGTDALLTAASTVGCPTWVLRYGHLDQRGDRGDCERGKYLDVDADEAAALLYTSGTTGKPKGAILTHANVLGSAEALSTVQGSGPDDRMGTALPLFHVYGQVPVMGAAYHVGGSLSLQRKFDAAQMLEMVAEHGLSEIAGVPTMWSEMLQCDSRLGSDDLKRLRSCLSGGAPLPVAVKRAFEERFGAPIVDGYGLTETAGAVTCGAAEHDLKEGSVGRAVPGTTIAILSMDGRSLAPGEVGQVAVDGRGVMREYWNRPAANAAVRAGRWFLTGDLGKVDADGDLWIVGRLKEVIIRGGYNVYPTEVEDAIYAHPAVHECAVIGIPDERLGEEVAAVLVFHPGSSIELTELRRWLGERLSSYKIPRIYQVSDALPKGATGKILKRELDSSNVAATGQRISREAVLDRSQPHEFRVAKDASR